MAELEKLKLGVFQRSLILYHYYLRLVESRRDLLNEVRGLPVSVAKMECPELIVDAGKLVTSYCKECLDELDKRLKRCGADWQRAKQEARID